MIKEIDGGMTEPISDELRNDGVAFDGSGYTIALELLQIGGTAWTAATDYAVGALTRAVPSVSVLGTPPAASGRVYQCITAGTSDASNEPVWPSTFGATVVDGTAEWLDITPEVIWAVAAVGSVLITNYHLLPRDTSYRARYVVMDGTGKTGPFPNLNTYNVWRVSAVMAG